DGMYDMGWDSLNMRRYQNMLRMGILTEKHRLSERPGSIPAWEDVEDKETWVRRMQVYAAMIDRMDQGIGKIVEYLKQQDELNNTVIMFLSDNGGCAENI